MADIHTSYMPTTGAKVTRKADSLQFPYVSRPQAMTVYARFVEMGTVTEGNRILQISATDTNPRLVLFQTATGQYAFRYQRSTADQSQAGIAGGNAPSLGDTVELVGQLAATGITTIIQSLNGGTEVSTADTGAIEFAPTWAGGGTLWIGNVNSTLEGISGFRNILIVRGVQSLASMRRMAGVAR